MRAKIINKDSVNFGREANAISIYTKQELQLSNHEYTHRLLLDDKWIPFHRNELKIVEDEKQ